MYNAGQVGTADPANAPRRHSSSIRQPSTKETKIIPVCAPLQGRKISLKINCPPDMQPQSFAHHPRSTGVGQPFLLGDPCARHNHPSFRATTHTIHRLPTTKKRTYSRETLFGGAHWTARDYSGCYSGSASSCPTGPTSVSLSLSLPHPPFVFRPPIHHRPIREKRARSHPECR